MLPVLMTVSQFGHFESCFYVASADDSVSEGTEVRDHHCTSVRNSVLYQTRTLAVPDH